jgi:cation:H+ antiporter
MLLDGAFLVAGLIILVMAGDYLVRGASSGALKLGVSPLLAGIAVVGFGTSAPEMIVAADAALRGAPEVAYGNIVGSNIANILLVLAVPALIAPIAVELHGLRRTVCAALIATAIWILLAGFGLLTPINGVLMLLGLVGYLGFTWWTARGYSADAAAHVGADAIEQPVETWPKVVGLVAIGLIGLPIGARLIVDGTVGIAEVFNIDKAIIGLTIVAVGTSLPELGAGIAAALRKQSDLAIGNVLGSNIFNILAAGGVTALASPAAPDQGFLHYDHPVMAASLMAVAIMIFVRKPIGRLTAIVFLAAYCLYIFGLIPAVGWRP